MPIKIRTLLIAVAISFCGSLSTPAGDLAFAHAYPVPFLTSRGDQSIVFSGLPNSVTIKIFTINGLIVQTLQERDGDGTYSWDVKSSDGLDVSSGIYLYYIQSNADEKVGKLVILR